MRFAVLLALSSSLLLTGCKTNCRQLSEKLCDCTTSTTEKTSCLQAASTKDDPNLMISPEQQAYCGRLVPDCDCRLIDTPAGKERCGIAVSADAGQ